MPLDPNEEVLEAAIRGIPKVAAAIVAVPPKARTRAVAAAEQSYRQTALSVGYNPAEVESWVEAVVYFLRAEIDAHAPLGQGNRRYKDAQQPVSPVTFARAFSTTVRTSLNRATNELTRLEIKARALVQRLLAEACSREWRETFRL
jgi:hypothetical protein